MQKRRGVCASFDSSHGAGHCTGLREELLMSLWEVVLLSLESAGDKKQTAVSCT